MKTAIFREIEKFPPAPRAALQCMYLAGCADWIGGDDFAAAWDALKEAEKNYKVVEDSGDYDPCLPGLRSMIATARATITAAEDKIFKVGEGF